MIKHALYITPDLVGWFVDFPNVFNARSSFGGLSILVKGMKIRATPTSSYVGDRGHQSLNIDLAAWARWAGVNSRQAH